ncbi:hypothetical protein K1W54_07170 [Micromonospora sp. CPCC 205371]|nr:hypothetical protein [Micromonospora sp. CPCC 205371]
MERLTVARWVDSAATAQIRVIGGRHEIGEVLGRGDMATVYGARARDRRLGRDVAMKMMCADLAHDGDSVSRHASSARRAAWPPSTTDGHSEEDIRCVSRRDAL